MKKRVYILVILYGSFMLSPLVPFVEYAWNYDYIVAEKCENKDKPELKCNGKCHLKKQLEETSGEQTTPEQTESFGYYEFLQFTVNSGLMPGVAVADVNQLHGVLEEQEMTGFVHSIFHPPRC